MSYLQRFGKIYDPKSAPGPNGYKYSWLLLYSKVVHVKSTYRSSVETPLDEYLELLANEKRRRLLYRLDTAEAEVSVPDDVPGSHSGSTERTTIEYCHQHLPKLDEAGVINWERETNNVEPGPEFEEIRPLFQIVESLDSE